MYELVWDGSHYHLVDRRSGSQRSAPGTPRGVQPGQVVPPVDRGVWQRFVRTGRIGSAPVPEPIRQSWDRCRQAGVDPAAGKCRDIRPVEQLHESSLRLRELIVEVREGLLELLRGRGLLLTVSDAAGYLLGMWGDPRALLAADRLSFGPGADWSESSVGTNAIGTALTCGRPMQVRAHEHFCETHHGWICSAAPIFDWQGRTVGCLDISGPTGSDHSQALILAVKGARALESLLLRREAAAWDQHYRNLIANLFEAVGEALVFLSPNGTIVSANAPAARLLGIDQRPASAVAIEQWFDFQPFVRGFRQDPQAAAVRGVPLHGVREPLRCARAIAILSPNQVLIGVLLVLEGPRSPRRSPASAPPPALPEPSSADDPFRALIGSHAGIREAVAKARRAAATSATVLITGESGTGKEVLAQALHRAGGRGKGPFVAVNCGAIPPDLIQSVLFGYEDGAFTGARRGGAPGKFEQASGGTLLLDEIGEMSLAMQVNLLRVLEERHLTRVGGTRAIPVNVRIVAATHRDLEAEVHRGAFRADLYYRLNVVRIHLPPLRERGADLRLLAEHFIRALALELERPVRFVAPDLFDCLMAHDWPGNVRELRHALEAAVTLMPNDQLRAEHLPDSIRKAARVERPPQPPGFNLGEIEAEVIRRAFHHHQGNITRMAQALGIGRNTLYAKMKKIGLL